MARGPGMAIVTLIDMQDVVAQIGGRTVLDGATLGLDGGEVVGLVGRNGAGKTSVFRAMLGLMPIRSGSVHLDGLPLANLTPVARADRVGYLPQERRIAWNMPVIEIVALATPFLDGEESRRRALAALVSLEAGDLADRGVADLSGGERARVLIARALNTPGRALLLDEPIAGLDPDAQAFVLRRLKAEAAAGRGVLMSLHDLTAAAQACDRVAVMAQGRVLVRAPPAEALRPEVLRQAFGIEASWVEGPAGPLLAIGSRQGA